MSTRGGCRVAAGRRPIGWGSQVADGGNRLRPFSKFDVMIMSLGFILDEDTPVIWRGPMVMKAIEQLLGLTGSTLRLPSSSKP